MSKLIMVGLRRWFLFVAALFMAGYLSPPVIAHEPVDQDTPRRPWTGPYASPLDRIGIGIHPRWGGPDQYDLGLLHPGWWSDWRTADHPVLPGMDYAQLILVRPGMWPPNWDRIQRNVRQNPGALWIIGNEPEGVKGQGSRTPTEYAQIYHEAYTRIKGWDATAQIAIGGVIQPTPLRLQWLDLLLSEYQRLYGEPMPVDVWNIHVQILNEQRNSWGADIPAGLEANEGMVLPFPDEAWRNADPALFKELVRAFRVWMNERGFRDKPLIISEYGVLLPSYYLNQDEAIGDQMVCDFIHETFRWLLDDAIDPEIGYPQDNNHLVQRWLWYSLNDRPFDYYDDVKGFDGFNGGLFDHQDATQLTKFGACFRDFVAPHATPSAADLVVRRINATTIPASGETPAGVCLTTTIANRGELASLPTSVQFFHGDPTTGGEMLATRQLRGDLSRYQPGVELGAHILPALEAGSEVCVQISLSSMIESDNTNNLLCTTITPVESSILNPLCAAHHVYLPLVGKNMR